MASDALVLCFAEYVAHVGNKSKIILGRSPKKEENGA